jgi:hypothetical protein
MTNHAIATIFILVHNFIIYFLLPKSEREDWKLFKNGEERETSCLGYF